VKLNLHNFTSRRLRSRRTNLRRKYSLNRKRNSRVRANLAEYGIEQLEARCMLAGEFIISEVMASNSSTLDDVDGDSSDWVEIQNTTAASLSLDGYHLTDDAADLTKWTFPNVQIDDYLVVFASNKDRTDPLQQLHTNFKISGAGEYLALVEPNGTTIAHDFSPTLPPQLTDISYGISASVSVEQDLVGAGADLHAFIPTDGSLGATWTGGAGDEPFDDSGWIAGDSSAGFDQNVQIDFETHINFQPAAADVPAGFDVDSGAAFGVRANGESYGWDQAVATTERAAQAQAELVAWWKFDEANGAVAADSSLAGSNHPATLVGSNPQFVPAGGQFGGAVMLPGVNEFINAGNHADFEFAADESYSISFWYKNNGAENTNNGLVTKGYDTTTRSSDGYYLVQASGSAGTATLDSRQGAGATPRITHGNSTVNIGNGSWNHVVVVRDSQDNQLQVYVNNGVPAITSISPTNGDWAMGTNSSPLIIGNHFNRYTPGHFDDVGIWKNKALSAGEIDLIFNGGIAGLGITSQQQRTFADLQDGGNRTWELAVPNGLYDVTASFGDSDSTNQINNIEIEGTTFNDPDGNDNFDLYSATVEVQDGRLTIAPAAGAVNTKINYVDVEATPIILFTGEFELDLEQQMAGQSPTAYLRYDFSTNDAAAFTTLQLDVKYDDGFVAFLNGTEVARRNAPVTPVFNSTALAPRDDALALQSESIDLTGFLGNLQEGANVLAFQALSESIGDANMLLVAELSGDQIIDQLEQYYTTPTPGAPNIAGALGLVEDTKFSFDRGFYTDPFQVEISTDTAAAETRYTLDGTRPTATTGLVYSDPIDITTTSTLRAASFLPGYLPSNVDTQTYIFPADVLVQDGSDLPNTSWGHAGPDWAMDPEVLNSADPETRPEADDFLTLGTVALSVDFDQFFGSGGIYPSGQGVEIATSFELFDVVGIDNEQIDASVQIVGGSSTGRWKSDKLSMRVKFSEQFGPTKFNYPVFGSDGASQFDTLVIDAQLNNVWHYGGGSDPNGQRGRAQFVRDQLVADLQNATGGYAPHGRHVHVYINGIYWGLHMLHERPDDNFTSQYLGGNAEDFDVIKHTSNNVVSGSNTNYLALLSAANQDMTNAANYQAVEDMLDMENFIDYMLVNYYLGNTDWAHHNWYASFNRVDPEGRWRFHSWDAEKIFQGVNDNLTNRDDANGPTHLHHQLIENSDYQLLFADRIQMHFYNDGLMTPGRVEELYLNRVNQIDDAIKLESARWGDNRRTQPYTRGGEWLTEQNRLLNSHIPQRTDIVLAQLAAHTDWLPSTAATAPTFSINNNPQHGGEITSGDMLGMTSVSNTIYYTLDGSDPRDVNGNVEAAALQYSGAIPINSMTQVGARVQTAGGEWSALSDARYFVNQAATAQNFVVTEINYNPHGPSDSELAVNPNWTGDDFEFVELQNTSANTIDLFGVEWNNGVNFSFDDTTPTTLGAGEFIVIVSNPAAFAVRYGAGINIAGTFDNSSLANNGEVLAVVDRFGDDIADFEFNDSGSWPGRADGNGSTLELIAPALPYADSESWRSSSEYGGTPGSAGIGPIVGVVINEVLTHTDLPATDSIELYNTTGGLINIGGWWLSDSSDDYRKFQIPFGTMLDDDSYIVFDEVDFNPGLGANDTDFSLNGAHGDDVWLLEGDGGGDLVRFIDRAEFGGAANGETIGRWPNGIGEFVPLISNTLDDTNSEPRIGPLFISEIHFNPGAQIDADDLEFVEIYNPTGAAEEMTQWQLRGGISYDFDNGFMLGSGDVAVVISFNPDNPENAARVAAFRAAHNIDESILLLGGFGGKLSDNGEEVVLLRPDSPPLDEPNFIPRLLEDSVQYEIVSPWPVSTNGQGNSLNRVVPLELGSESNGWSAAAPTPGDFSSTLTVLNVAINQGFDDPADLAGKGPQPSSWFSQRSDLRNIEVVLSRDVIVNPADIVLTNLGIDADNDPDQIIALSVSHIQVEGNKLTLTFEQGELASGVYQLELLPSLLDINSNPIDGNADGTAGDAFMYQGNNSNNFYRILSDFNGDKGVSVFDFTTFSYWFGTSIPAAPTYADMNEDDGVSVFDFTSFSQNFGIGVQFTAGFGNSVLFTAAVEEATGNTTNEGRGLHRVQIVEPSEPTPQVLRSTLRRNEPLDLVIEVEETIELEELLDELAIDIAEIFRGR
jgi:hypothetical protein